MNDNDSKGQWGKDVFTLLSWFKIERVQQAKVLVVGAGALGNEVLKNLALFGVGNIVVVDFDTIEYSNLTRSILFRECDADKGLYKSQVAAQRIKEINPTINVHAIVGKLHTDVGLGLYRNMDVVIGCLDSRMARLQLNRQCMRANVPWVDGSIENLDGMAKVFRKGTNCYECELPDNTKQILFQKMSCADVAHRNTSAGRVPTTPVIASIIGAIQAQEAMKIIHEKDTPNDQFTSLCGKWFCYEGSHNSTSIYNSAIYADDCPAHEDWDPVVEIDSLGADTTIADTLDMIRQKLQCNTVEINLRNDKFVDKIATRGDNKVYSPMLPESHIADYIDSTPELYCRLQADINQNSYENIDADFPYQSLTLRQIGIPDWDILQVATEKGYAYVELSHDRWIF